MIRYPLALITRFQGMADDLASLPRRRSRSLDAAWVPMVPALCPRDVIGTGQILLY